MTYTIKRNGQEIELTSEECKAIFRMVQRGLWLADMAETWAWERDRFDSDEEAEYVRAHLEDGLEDFEAVLEFETDTDNACRSALDHIADDYKELKKKGA